MADPGLEIGHTWRPDPTTMISKVTIEAAGLAAALLGSATTTTTTPIKRNKLIILRSILFVTVFEMNSSSSDSDTSERVCNLHSVLVKSKERNLTQASSESYSGQSYKRKLGDLIFNASFEGGNLGFVERIDQYNYDLMVRPDVANPRHRLWFNFTVSNQLPSQCVVFNFVNLSDYVRAFHEGLTPVARSRSKPNWLRLHIDQVFYHRSQYHGRRYVLSVAFKFASHDDEHQFALFYPYTLTSLLGFIRRWSVELKRQRHDERFTTSTSKLPSKVTTEQFSTIQHAIKSPDLNRLRLIDQPPRSKSAFGRPAIRTTSKISNCINKPSLQVNTLATSILSKSIYNISIRPAGFEVHKDRPTLVMLCRLGGNLDTAASFVCQGTIDYALSNTLVSQCARHLINFEILPMIDVDSIWVGNSRTDILGQPNHASKLERASPVLYSNLSSVKKLIKEICSADGRRVVIIELRVNLDLVGIRLIGTNYDNNIRMERHLAFPRLMSRFCDSFYLENCQFVPPRDMSKFSFNFNKNHKVDQYKLEISANAAYKRTLLEVGYEHYDQTRYLAIGKSIVYSVLDLFKSKDKPLPDCVNDLLHSFKHKANDTDHLMLTMIDN